MPKRAETMHVDLIVKGRVQGVSFRAYTKRVAQSLALTGYVRNLSNGNVEIKAEGTKESLYKLIKWCRNEGSPASEVKDIEINWSEKLEKYGSFRIKLY